MGYNDKIFFGQKRNDIGSSSGITRTIYYGEVVSIEDDTETGRIKVRIPDLDSKILSENLPDCYPILPSFFYVLPKLGEAVRVFIEDVKYPYRGRHWMGSIISQLNRTENDPYMSALSGTNVGLFNPNKAPSSYPNSKGIYPEKNEIGILGRKNNDIILGENNLKIRVGKHEINDVYVLNKTNPAVINLNLSETKNTTTIITSSDKLAFLSSKSDVKYNITDLDDETIENIFNSAHPMVRGDLLVEILKIMKNAISNHIHSYNAMPPTKTNVINDNDMIDFSNILQKNIVIN